MFAHGGSLAYPSEAAEKRQRLPSAALHKIEDIIFLFADV